MGFEEVDSNIHLSHQLKGVNVLLVDYEQNSLSKSTLLLREASFKVSPTKIQQVALTLLQERPGRFNLIITTDQKQDMDCHSFIQRIRSIQEDIPIVVVSSLGSNADQGLRTLYDSACYVVNKPLTENALLCVLQWQLVRRKVHVRTERHEGNGKQVIGNVANNGDPGNESSLVDPKGVKEDLAKGDQREEVHGLQEENSRKLKRSKPCEDEEAAAEKKKGKSVVVDSCTTKVRKTMKGKGEKEEPPSKKNGRPTFDVEQHKKLMESIAYNGPTKPIDVTRYLPRTGQEFTFPLSGQGKQRVHTRAEEREMEKKIKQAFSSTPRAPWTQHLYQKLRDAMSSNNAPDMGGYGYGVQQSQPLQLTSRRQPPSWMSAQAWRAQMHSELLGNASHVAMGPFPAPTVINEGLDIAASQMPMNTNMENINGLNDSVGGMRGVRVNGMTQNINTGTLSNPILLDVGEPNNALATHCVGVPNNGVLNGFFQGAQDEMGFGSFARDNSPSTHQHTTALHSLQTEMGHWDYMGLLEAENGNSMMSTQIAGFNENTSYGHIAASNELRHTDIAFPYSSVSMNEPGLHTVNPPEFTPTVTSTLSALQNTYGLSTSNTAPPEFTPIVPGTELMSFNFSPPYNSVNVDRPDLYAVDRQQLSYSGANAPFGLQNTSNFPITTSGLLGAVDDASLQAVARSGFQSSNGALPTGSHANLWPNPMPGWINTYPQTNQAQVSAYTATNREVEEYLNHEFVNEQNVVPGQAFVSPSTFQLETSANKSIKQASEEEEKAKDLTCEEHVDEFADLFTYSETNEGGASSVLDEALNSDKGIAEAEDNTYFDFDSFGFI